MCFIFVAFLIILLLIAKISYFSSSLLECQRYFMLYIVPRTYVTWQSCEPELFFYFKACHACSSVLFSCHTNGKSASSSKLNYFAFTRASRQTSREGGESLFSILRELPRSYPPRSPLRRHGIFNDRAAERRWTRANIVRVMHFHKLPKVSCCFILCLYFTMRLVERNCRLRV